MEENTVQSVPITIVYAGYGVWNSVNDATQAIRNAYFLRGVRNFYASNNWAGDPAPGERKYLFIVWTHNGVTSSAVVGEDDSRGVWLP
ncbi:DUF3395 domain-containing protein [Paenibacillus sp. 481]|uniref:DUF3395 domain-containing protein n=1 Tax=Paenibacillus sp. 481 TaxID=2835869 RepID=UPI001E34B354|nr:DUF3395 domain-containing protein [Paenibacillus sp. 481]UHA72116.1 hypothetical protein KIK04_15575 [Paenibacillus sp. 481]